MEDPFIDMNYPRSFSERNLRLQSPMVIIWPLNFLANEKADKRKLKAVKFERIKQQSES